MRLALMLAAVLSASPALAQNFAYRIGLVDGNGRREYRYYDAGGVRVTESGIPIDANRRTLDLILDRSQVTSNLMGQAYAMQVRMAAWQASSQQVAARANSINRYVGQANAAIGADGRDAYREKLRNAGLPENRDMTDYLFDPEGRPRPGRLQAQLDAASDQVREVSRQREELSRAADDLNRQLAELDRSAAGSAAIGNRIQRQQAAERFAGGRPSTTSGNSDEDLSWLRAELNRQLHGGPTGSHR